MAGRRPGRLQFHFLPFYASWLNQIEMWFATLQRRLLRRADSPSAEHLEAQIVAFIATHNRLFAHPYGGFTPATPGGLTVGHELPPMSSSRRARRGADADLSAARSSGAARRHHALR